MIILSWLGSNFRARYLIFSTREFHSRDLTLHDLKKLRLDLPVFCQDEHGGRF